MVQGGEEEGRYIYWNTPHGLVEMECSFSSLLVKCVVWACGLSTSNRDGLQAMSWAFSGPNRIQFMD